MNGLFGRQKLLLAALKSLREHRGYGKLHTPLMKTLFLLSREYELGGLKPYSFFPYKYGPYSSTAFADLTYRLERQGLLDENEELTPGGESQAKTLKPSVLAAVTQCVSRFGSDKEILEYVYSNYPAYAQKSELAPRKAEATKPAIFTAGYEGRDIDAFLDLLIQNRVEVLVDVRNNPFSMNFEFIKSKLSKRLKSVEITYLHFPEMGVESEKRRNLESAEDYSNLFEDYEKNTLQKQAESLQKIAGLGARKRIALMCFEHEASNCHRGIIAKALRGQGMEVTDI